MDLSPTPSRNEDRYLRWIAFYIFGKGLLLCLLAIGILGFLHKDVDTIVGNWMTLLGFNMENRHVVTFLARLDKVTDKQLAEWSGITFAVAGMFVTQATGLLLRQQWAKYLTVSVTASLIPVEIFELFRHFGWIKVGVLGANIAIVTFLIVSLAHEKRQRQRQRQQFTPKLAAPPRAPAVECEPV
jgi:uncharacterized membrane protein (DUF2068 family)